MSAQSKFLQPDALRMVLSGPIVRRSIWVAIIVGTILTLINQGDTLLAEGQIDVVKALLTYLVPFGVSSYGAYCVCCASPNPPKQ